MTDPRPRPGDPYRPPKQRPPAWIPVLVGVGVLFGFLAFLGSGAVTAIGLLVSITCFIVVLAWVRADYARRNGRR